MDGAVRDCLVAGYQPLIDKLHLPDPGDRHILAGAILGRADVIVTFNEADFPPEKIKPYGLHTRHPDHFILDVIDIDPEACVERIRWDLGHYRNPPLQLADYVGALRAAGLTKTADRVSGLETLLT
jgi:hypothetical protein